MMKWRWYRSSIFWAGIFVMISIVWAWSESTETSYRICGEQVRIEHWSSGIAIAKHDRYGTRREIEIQDAEEERLTFELSGCANDEAELLGMNLMRMGSPGFHRYRVEVDPAVLARQDLLPKDWDPVLRYQMWWGYAAAIPASGWVAFVPHWLLLASFAVSWVILLFWRSRRKGHG